MKIAKHGLEIREKPTGKGFENMQNKVVFETSAEMFIGKNRVPMKYVDFSDGTHYLHFEIFLTKECK